MAGWKISCIGFSYDPITIGGIAVWKEDWRKVDAPQAMLPHPAYQNQIHAYGIYEIGPEAAPIRFAACELSNTVWGFYVPSDVAEVVPSP